MKGWRIVAIVLAVVLTLAQFGILGFHEPAEGAHTLILVAMTWIIWCICDAVDKITGESSKWW